MYFNFLQLLDRTFLNLSSGTCYTIQESIISNDITITSALRTDTIILGINFLLL